MEKFCDVILMTSFWWLILIVSPKWCYILFLEVWFRFRFLFRQNI